MNKGVAAIQVKYTAHICFLFCLKFYLLQVSNYVSARKNLMLKKDEKKLKKIPLSAKKIKKITQAIKLQAEFIEKFAE